MSRNQRETPQLKTITDFKSRLTGGGARPNLFEVELNFPSGVDNPKEEARFLVKAAALPSSTINPIEIPFRGRILKIAGDRTFDTWTITVMNDSSFKIRSAFEEWMNLINKLDNGTGTTDTAVYQQDATVRQLDRDGAELRKYTFKDIFPTNMSTIDLSYDTTDTIEEFTVEMQVHYWEAFVGTADNAGGKSIR